MAKITTHAIIASTCVAILAVAGFVVLLSKKSVPSVGDVIKHREHYEQSLNTADSKESLIAYFGKPSNDQRNLILLWVLPGSSVKKFAEIVENERVTYDSERTIYILSSGITTPKLDVQFFAIKFNGNRLSYFDSQYLSANDFFRY